MQYACEQLADGWLVRDPDGVGVRWSGMNAGPLRLGDAELDELCRLLLRAPLADIEALAQTQLRRMTPGLAREPALILHSTTPEKRTFEGELAALAGGRSPYDSATHAETRATLFARPGDLLVGRTEPWKHAIACDGLDGVALPGCEHYYLSHALLDLAARRPAALEPIVAFVRARPRVIIRVYALEPAMLVFLLWLRRAADVPALHVDANDPAVTRAWNRKSILYPTVEAAAALPSTEDPRRMLAAEAAESPLAQLLGATVPTLPGYTLVRDGHDLVAFTRQLTAAAELLRARYGLRRGCLKAAVAGGGTRITPNVELGDHRALARLAAAAHLYGDDQVLEAHVVYDTTTIGGRTIPLAPSAHIRGGQVAPGLTLQLTRGTTWVGNIYLDAASAGELGLSPTLCDRIDAAMHALRRGFERIGGLTIGGVDFSLGSIGGVFGDESLLAMQDPNLSFNGAECLRAFLERVPPGDGVAHGATLVVRPAAGVTLATLRAACRSRTPAADAFGVVPERSCMLAIHGERPRDVGERLFALAASLQEAGLLLA